MSNVGFRIYKNSKRPPQDLVDSLGALPVAVIGDEVSRRGCMHSRIRPFNKRPMIGSAITVRVRPGDNLLLHRALDIAGPGDIIVVDGQGELSNALAGENMTLWAQQRGVSGIVLDGAIRDVEAIAELRMPVFAAGTQPNGPYKSGPGEINTPITCGGVVVHPGDIVAGDADGVVVIRPADAPAVLARAEARQRKEVQTRETILAGTYDRSSTLR